MTQTSDDCPNSSSSGGGGSSDGGSSSTSSSRSRTTVMESIRVVDRDKKEKEKGIDVSICEESAVAVKVSNAEEESTEIPAKKDVSDAAGIYSGNANVTSSYPPAVVTNTLSSLDDLEKSPHASLAPMCAVCFEPCICYCKSCKKVSYCSKEHQKIHWKQHRPECFPVTIQVSSVFGNHLVVTRDIRRGEVILCERPLLTAPFLDNFGHNQDNNSKENSTSQNRSICLSCHKIMWHGETNDSACSKCRWPICCPECEKHPIHADQECKIFAEYHVEPSALCDMDAQFMCVALLRILQHKKSHPTTSSSVAAAHVAIKSSKWSQFMDVVNKQMPMKDGFNLAEAKKATARFSDLIRKSLGSIICNEFSVTDAEIDQIVRAIRTSSFITDNDGNYINGFSGFSLNNKSNLGQDSECKTTNISSSNSGNFLTVYHLASMLTSNCVPNASWVIQQPSLDFYLRASTPIKTGERINITFVDPLLGTQERRQLLWKEKCLSCSCSRCSDPTESCTFFSAIKCPGKKMGKEQAMAARKICSDGEGGGVICECEGYLLPTDPLAVTFTSLHSSFSFYYWNAALTQVDEDTTKHGRKDDFPPGEKLCEEERMVEWKCNVCLTRQPWGFVLNSLGRMRRFFLVELEQSNDGFTSNIEEGTRSSSSADKVAHEESRQKEKFILGNPECNNNLEVLEARVDKVDSLVGNVAHANHYYILKMENEILKGISELLEKGQVPFEEMEKWALRMIELCKKGLKVVNILCPGLSRERGRLLYYLQQGLTISLLFKTSRAMRVAINPPADNMSSNKSVNKEILSHEELMKKFYEVILARKEILEIFAMAKDDTREREMLRAVQQDSIEVRLLKNYFKSHQNILTVQNIINVKM